MSRSEMSRSAGWRHYRGDESTGIEHYRVTHRAVIGWRTVSVLR
jgi:hypothetical protein